MLDASRRAPSRRRAEQHLDRLRRAHDPEALSPAAAGGIHPEVEVGRVPDRGRRLPEHAGPPRPCASMSRTTAPRRRSRFCSTSSATRAMPGAGPLETLKREFDTRRCSCPRARRRQPRGARSRDYLPYRPDARPAHGANCTSPSRRPPTTRPSRPSRLRPPMSRAVADDAQGPGRRAPSRRSSASLPKASGAARRRSRSCSPGARRVLALIDRLAGAPAGAIKTRIHGDYHLGQVLIVAERRHDRRLRGRAVAAGGGAPRQELAAARRGRDAALLRLCDRDRARGTSASASAGGDAARIAGAAEASRSAHRDRLPRRLRGSRRAAPRIWVEDDSTPPAPAAAALLAKALYEINYEADHRPDWIETPVRGVLSILDKAGAAAMSRNPSPKSAGDRPTRAGQSGPPEAAARRLRRERRGGDPRRRAMATRSRSSGRIRSAPGVWEVRAMLPEASAVEILSPDGTTMLAAMERRHEAGFFVARSRRRRSSDLPPVARDRRPGETCATTPIRSAPILSGDDLAAMRDVGGDAHYRMLGAQSGRRRRHRRASTSPSGPRTPGGSASSATSTDWDGRRHPMRLRHDGGVWELFIPRSAPGPSYKFEIKGADGAPTCREGRPLRLRSRAPAGDRLGRCTAHRSSAGATTSG